jgi:hypothetical protein
MTDSSDPTFEEAMNAIGFPPGFASRPSVIDADVEAVMNDHDRVREGRRYATPLLLTLIAQVEVFLAAEGVDQHGGGVASVRSPVDERGREANQLILKASDGSYIALRPFYNRLEALVIGDMMRLGFPTGPGYNTGQWRRYEGTIDRLLAMDPGARREVAGRLWGLIEALCWGPGSDRTAD